MCGRFSEIADKKKLAKELKIPVSKIPNVKPRYNVSPSQDILAMTQEGEEDSKLEMLRWGLVPSWAKDETIGHRMINARAETITEKPSFRSPFKKTRCLIVADGFYEWRKDGERKAPYYIRLSSGDVFTFAGLWTTWKKPDGNPLRSCTIITTAPNKLLAPIHNRMPVIIPDGERKQWLYPGNSDPVLLRKHLKAYPAEYMEAYPVSTLVNSPKNNVAECIKALP